MRLVSPGLTGFDVPPDVATVGHPSGAALVLGMVVKEVPYLVLMTTAALAQVRLAEHHALARSLGYGPVEAWLRIVLPQVWRQVRLPVLAVLAYSLSVVDVALILGPGNPPTLAVLAVRWFGDPDIRLWFPAAAAATLQLIVVAASIGAWLLVERVVALVGARIVAGGRRTSALSTFAGVARGGRGDPRRARGRGDGRHGAVVGRHPMALPVRVAGARSASTAGRDASARSPRPRRTRSSSARSRRSSRWRSRSRASKPSSAARRAGPPPALALLYLPLLVPQVAFLFGAQVLLVRAELDGALVAVVWAHLIYVLPYLFLSLADPWRALDPRYARTRGEPRRLRVARALRGQAADPRAAGRDRVRGRVRGQRRPVPADAVRRQRAACRR